MLTPLDGSEPRSTARTKMPASQPALAGINPGATSFSELNDLLVELTTRARAILAENFVGSYLQGSFALGDADIHSDCDFLIPVRRSPNPDEEAALRSLHDEIPTRDEHWAHNIEGSYPVQQELQTLQALDRPWLYVDRGWRTMQWSTHCNTEVARWCLRERGVTLVGPDPTTLVDAVPPAALRERMQRTAVTLLPELATWISLDVAWGQRYAVTAACRILYTLDTAEVASKRAALLWAIEHTEPRWRPLLEQVLADRARGWDPADTASPESVEMTRAFAEYVERVATSSRESRTQTG